MLLVTSLPRFRARGAAVALASFALPALLSAGCGRETSPPEPAGRRVRATVVAAEQRPVPVIVTASGSVAAGARADVSTRLMGWVRRVHVQEGQVVRAGAPLVTIDDADLRARRAQVEAGIEEARAVLAHAEKTAARFERLQAEKAVSRQQLDDVLTGRDRAQAGLAAALAGRDEIANHLRYLDITSPIDGLVVRKTVQPGDMASPGVPLVSVEQVDRMKIVARLSEKDVGAVAVDDTVAIEVPAVGSRLFRVPVTKVVPAAEPGSRTFDVEALVPNGDGLLKSGMFARMLVTSGHRDAVLVPATAVITHGQLRGVHVVGPDGTVTLRWVRVGRGADGRVEILAGLAGGESLAVSPAEPLAEGDRVVSE